MPKVISTPPVSAMSGTSDIDRFVAAARPPERIDAELARRTGKVIVDTLAVIAAGCADDTCRSYLQALPERPRGIGRTAEETAFALALPTTVLQLDEGHRTSRSHPAIHVVPAALAVGAETGASGEEVLAAVVAGYEVAAAIGVRLGPIPPDMHPHASRATFGAAIAAAILWGADDSTRYAVLQAIASLPMRPMAGPENVGASIHHTYVPAAVQTAISLTRAVVHGATVDDRAWQEHYLRWFAADGGDTSTTQADARTPAIMDNYFKYRAACGHTHTAIQAMEELTREPDWDADAVEHVRVSTYREAALLEEPAPKTNLAARFSLPFLLARTAVRGSVGSHVLRPDDLFEERTTRLAGRVQVMHDEQLDAGYPDSRPANVEITLADGSLRGCRQDDAFGDTRAPAPFEVWERKCHDLLGNSDATELIGFVSAPPTSWDARDLLAAVAPVMNRYGEVSR